MLGDFAIRVRQNIGLVTAVVLFSVLYLLYHLAHPKGFSSAVLVQNADEVFTLAMLAMAQTVPVLAGGLDLSVGALMTHGRLLRQLPPDGLAGRHPAASRHLRPAPRPRHLSGRYRGHRPRDRWSALRSARSRGS